MNRLINRSNHPSDKWSKEQVAAAMIYGEVIDMPFPMVNADASENDVEALANVLINKIQNYGSPGTVTVHVMGEMTLTYNLVRKLKEASYKCVASTTDRMVRDLDDGRKEVTFRFVKFREY